MKNKSIGHYIIGSAIIWGLVIVGCSLKLKGTPYFEEISLILIGGSTFHLLLIWPMVAIQFKKNNEKIVEIEKSNQSGS